ncbi:hypothetical protein QCA50_011484 [Cerrena zonata]|uniref:Uncharacterized protein n=1 Tax=Cerrena zonata TaxID=2478898 RepID=A0AAW0G791_9APHY
MSSPRLTTTSNDAQCLEVSLRRIQVLRNLADHFHNSIRLTQRQVDLVNARLENQLQEAAGLYREFTVILAELEVNLLANFLLTPLLLPAPLLLPKSSMLDFLLCATLADIALAPDHVVIDTLPPRPPPLLIRMSMTTMWTTTINNVGMSNITDEPVDY